MQEYQDRSNRLTMKPQRQHQVPAAATAVRDVRPDNVGGVGASGEDPGQHIHHEGDAVALVPGHRQQDPVDRRAGVGGRRALGVERLDYRPAAPREDVVPERVLRQERMRGQEEARLAEASS